MNRNLLLLAFCQGMFMTTAIAFIAMNGLVGLSLAPVGWMATLPVTSYVVGGALSAPLVARLQARWGRKPCFQLGLAVAAVSAAACALAVQLQSFGMLMATTTLAGFYQANAALYRFAGAELVEPSYMEKAISLVLAGGIVGAFIGPNLADVTVGLLPTRYVGAYLSLIGVAAVAALAMAFVRFPPHQAPAPGSTQGRPLREIARQPVFIVAVAAGALGYGVMNLLMAATPIAMQQCKHPFSSATLVLEWHVLGMYVPSFFTGHLIKRFGALPIMAVGVVLNVVCVAVALSGVDLMQFIVALFVLGVGWNFLYTGGSTLLTTTYRPEETNKAQGAMDTCVFATMALSSFASGVLVTTQGWTLLNLGSLLPIAAVGLALLWLARGQRPARA
jgi:MFS family permease